MYPGTSSIYMSEIVYTHEQQIREPQGSLISICLWVLTDTDD
jgi:hypothetical protein